MPGSVETQNILDSVEAGALRIGHGIAMRGNSEVQKMIRKKESGVEMCPIRNLQTKAVESEKASIRFGSSWTTDQGDD